MEKSKPHWPLPFVKTLIDAGKVRSTLSALSGAAAMGFEFEDMLDIIKALTLKDFYESMTTQADHRIWQDVYRPSTPSGKVYLKLTFIDVLIVTFKEL